MDLVVVVRAGELEGCVFTIAQGDQKTIGRAPECEIHLPDQGVSRCHCTVYNTGAVLRVVDLESANGTCINGQLVGRGALGPGDQLAVGPVILECTAEPTPEGVRVEPTAESLSEPEPLSPLPPNQGQFLCLRCPKCKQTLYSTWESIERASGGYDIVCVCEHCGHRWLQEKFPP